MKRFIIVLAFMAGLTAYNCTPENLRDEVELIDPDKTCPPNDRNCNGIPDDQEV